MDFFSPDLANNYPLGRIGRAEKGRRAECRRRLAIWRPG